MNYTCPELTFTETGWRKSLAAYRIAVVHEHYNNPSTAKLSVDDALKKLGITSANNIRTTVGAVENILDCGIPMWQIYDECEKLELVAEDLHVSDRDILRIVHILARHEIYDFTKYAAGSYSAISGIGPKYARILDKARAKAQIKEAREGLKIIDMHLRVRACLRDRYNEMAKEDGITMNELASKVLLDYASNRPLKK